MENDAYMLTGMSDEQLKRDVEAELEWEPSIDAAHIGVRVKDGIVTLAGHVSSYAEKRTAEEAAKRVYGVKAVANELDVKLPGSNKRTDEDIAADAVRAFKWNLFIPADKIKVVVTDGWVTLEGQVRWRFQRNAAERAVQNLPGVIGVTNNIVVGSPEVSPTDIKGQIESAFARLAELEARRLRVEVEGNKVILHGRVRSWAEKEEAERAAWMIPGVLQVDNQIGVTP
ncbi:MAG TPA: BON domain-containing protein [Gemmataceae bacterium]|nr:BON domain-containing protein [Gemmataceae bacterium]